MKLVRLLRDNKGTAAIEMAFAMPILILFLYGMFIIGLLFEANASLHNALGQGARYATLWDTPSDSQIITKIQASYFPMAYGTFNTPTVSGTTAYKDLSVSFTVTPDLLFFTMSPMTITRTKRVRLSEKTATS